MKGGGGGTKENELGVKKYTFFLSYLTFKYIHFYLTKSIYLLNFIWNRYNRTLIRQRFMYSKALTIGGRACMKVVKYVGIMIF